MCRWHHFALALVGAIVFVGSAYAVKQCGEQDILIPGVDADGNLNVDQAGELQCRQCFNTKNDKLSLKCRGRVGNESGKKQIYKNPEGLLGALDRVIYKVKVNGDARLTAKGVVEM